MHSTFSNTISVPNGYTLEYTSDVYSVMTTEFRERLSSFLANYKKIQATRNTLPSELIADFPFVRFKKFKNEIYSRKRDLDILECVLKDASGGMILEIGAWNGWLSSRLAKQNYSVISADIFRDETNGLASKKYHKTKPMLSLQTDLRDPSIYKIKFDHIIFNHSLQFLPDPETILEAYSKLLQPRGQLIILGLDYRKNEARQYKRVKAYREKFFNENGFQIHFYDAKGFADTKLMNYLTEKKFEYIPYRKLFVISLLKKLKGDYSGVFYYKKYN